ncbi:MAG: hypothetical protein KGJ84_01850 [Elusimicrobia bacterium]|nr:hypothetical protein [Elusimicrobiota bacterium]
MPRLLPEAPPLRPPARTAVIAACAGAAFAGFGGLLARWCADPLLGWTIALAAAAAGAAAGSFGNPPDEDGARAWTLGGALAALSVPALLRLLGLALADPSLLQNPLGTPRRALFVLGQAGALAALAAAAWTRATRGGGRGTAAAAALGAAAGACAFSRIDPPALLALAALVALASAELSDRPWTRTETAPLRARVFAAAAAAGLFLAWSAPRLLPDVWMARLHATYPGGRYLALDDDGRHVWAAYRFSTGEAVALRDGRIQSLDLESSRVALCAVLNQFEGRRSLLVLGAPTPQLATMAAFGGAAVAVEGISPAESRAFDALTEEKWRVGLSTGPFRPDSALLVVAPSARAFMARRAAAEVRRLRARMDKTAALGVMLPAAAAPGTAARVLAAAQAAFGNARAADLPSGVLILASTDPIVVDSQLLFGRLSATARASYPNGDRELASDLRWRAAPSAK